MIGLVCEGEPGLALRPCADRIAGSREGGVSPSVVQLRVPAKLGLNTRSHTARERGSPRVCLALLTDPREHGL